MGFVSATPSKICIYPGCDRPAVPPHPLGGLGVPALDVKVVPAELDRCGEGHGFNTAPSEGTSAAVQSAAGKIRAKAQLLAGVALDAPAESLRWHNGAFLTGTDPSAMKK